MPGALNHPLLAGLTAVEGVERELDMAGFMDIRGSILEGWWSIFQLVVYH